MKMKESIIEIKKNSTHRRAYDYCNTCNCEIKSRTNVLNLGRNNRCFQINLCDKCLNIFADRLWQYLEQAEVGNEEKE